MSGPPEHPDGPPMDDEMSRAWGCYYEATRRLVALEEIAERLAATSADPVAVSDFWLWKAGAT